MRNAPSDSLQKSNASLVTFQSTFEMRIENVSRGLFEIAFDLHGSQMNARQKKHKKSESVTDGVIKFLQRAIIPLW